MWTLLLYCAICGALSWLFKTQFPLWGWVKVTGWLLFLIFAIYWGVMAFLSIVPIPIPTLR